MDTLNIITAEASRNINGGKRNYKCPFCRYTAGYWSTYAHALRCSYFNSRVYRLGWNTAFALLKRGLGM